MYNLLLAVLLLLAPVVTYADNGTTHRGVSRGVVTISGGGGGIGTLYNDSTKNIFDTYDPICNPSTAVANGIVFCDGFEDKYVGNGNNPSTSTTDAWGVMSSNGGGCTGCSDTNDSAGTFDTYDTGTAGNGNFAVYNTGTINTSKANFGAAGTPGAMTQGWGRDIEPTHCLRAVGGDPLHCYTSSSTADEMSNIYVRMYIKFAGTTSERCNAGFGGCPSPSVSGGSGMKLNEWANTLTTGGVGFPDNGTRSPSSGTLYFSLGYDTPYYLSANRCGGGTNAGKAGFVNEGIPSEDFYVYPHLQGINIYSFNEHWWYLEYHVKSSSSAAADDGVIEMWSADCGADGKQCTTSPTKHIGATNLDILVDSDCPLPRALYINGWTQGTDFEIQRDEIVVRDGSVVNSPIGFETVH